MTGTAQTNLPDDGVRGVEPLHLRLQRILKAPLARAATAALVAVWLTLVIGFVEILVLLFRQHVLGMIVFVPREFVWLTPLSYLVHFWRFILIAAFIAALVRRIPLGYVTVLPFVFLGVFSLLLITKKIHVNADAILALGVGIQAARMAVAREAKFQRVVRRTLPALVALVVIIAATQFSWRTWRERSAYASLTAAPRAAPNVILIILDTVRAAELSLYGYKRPTSPQLERLAQHGVLFERAYAPSSWTLPTHASLFTGQYPTALSADWLTPLDDRETTLAEIFRGRGYATAGISANHVYAGWETGIDRGFIRFEDYRLSWEQLRMTSSYGQDVAVRRLERGAWRRRYHRTWAEHVNRRFFTWLDKRPTSRPFFVFLNYFDAHGPYRSPPRFLEQIGGNIGQQRDLHNGAIARIDQSLGVLLDSLERRGLRDNTLVVITADHGEQFGEHGLYDHGNSLYLPLLHVPLLVLYPKETSPGQRIAQPVSLRDVPATILDLAGVSGTSIPGTSLAPSWRHTATTPQPLSPLFSSLDQGVRTPPNEPVSLGEMFSLIDESWHYVLNGDGSEELYDLAADPAENRNLVTNEASKPVLARMRQQVAKLRAADDRHASR